MLRDLQDEICRLKRETDTAILAHSYQSTDILEVADLTGDSYALAVKARDLPQKNLVMCGVQFMAETLKMLSPEKRVLLPVASATCPMAEQIAPERVRAFKAAHPEYKVVAYINTTAALKAECDVCVTSSSALKIVAALEERDILFIPDRNLGGYVKKQLPEKNILLWDGCCPIHDSVTEQDVLAAKAAHPNAKFLMHPELPAEVLRYGDVIGSTAEIIRYALEQGGECVIGTEKSIADYLNLKLPEGRFYPMTKKLMCPDMRITSLSDVCAAITGRGGAEITMDAQLIARAKKPIEEMIRLGG